MRSSCARRLQLELLESYFGQRVRTSILTVCMGLRVHEVAWRWASFCLAQIQGKSLWGFRGRLWSLAHVIDVNADEEFATFLHKYWMRWWDWLDLQSQNRACLLFLHPVSERTTQEQKTLIIPIKVSLIIPIKVFLFSNGSYIISRTTLHKRTHSSSALIMLSSLIIIQAFFAGLHHFISHYTTSSHCTTARTSYFQ